MGRASLGRASEGGGWEFVAWHCCPAIESLLVLREILYGRVFVGGRQGLKISNNVDESGSEEACVPFRNDCLDPLSSLWRFNIGKVMALLVCSRLHFLFLLHGKEKIDERSPVLAGNISAQIGLGRVREREPGGSKAGIEEDVVLEDIEIDT